MFVKVTSEELFAKLISARLPLQPEFNFSTNGSITLNSTSDLFLAYNKVDYVLSGTKSNGKWNLTIKFTDVYDFDRIEWRDGVAGYSDAVAIINNYAVRAQEEGAIVPFNIMVTVKASFTV